MPTSTSTYQATHRFTESGPMLFPSNESGIETDPIRARPGNADEVLAAFATVSRRINDLARELKCLGYFDDGNDRPRAA